MRSATKILLAALPVLAAAQQTCNISSACGSEAPCCSEFGFCGADNSFCHGGCNPLYSNSLDSCAPAPLCQNAVYTFETMDSIMPVASYNGNASAAAWTLDKGNISLTTEGELAVLLTEDNGGTRLSTTHYVHYGTISASLKTGKWPGVVTAFITMSDVRDEIDWEWPGAQVFQAQSNYFWEGVIPAQTLGATHNVSSDTSSNYHTYTIDWQPDALSWSIDGNVVRTVNKADTKDATGVFNYPTTPSRVQLSLWPAGINTSAPGTVQWAGGMIDWNSPDYAAAGHYYALVKNVTVQCATNSAAGAVPAGAVSYVYGQNVSGVPSVLASNESSVTGAAPRAVAAGAVLRTLALAGVAALVGMAL